MIPPAAPNLWEQTSKINNSYASEIHVCSILLLLAGFQFFLRGDTNDRVSFEYFLA